MGPPQCHPGRAGWALPALKAPARRWAMPTRLAMISDDPNLPGEMQTTITLKKVSCGTELNIVQEGLPDVIPPEPCCLGWQESLTLLTKLVEAEIPD